MTKKEIKQKYLAGQSMFQIAKHFGCSVHKVVYWMKKYDINRRSRSEAIYLFNNPNGDPFSIKNNLTEEEILLKGMGLGIYWGEGNKTSKNSLRVSNTDPYLIKTFRSFLRQICQVKESKIGYAIVCFNDSDPQKVKSYWSKELKISPEKFGKIVQVPPQGKGTYKRKSIYGVCTLRFNNTKLKRWLMDKIVKRDSAWVAQW